MLPDILAGVIVVALGLFLVVVGYSGFVGHTSRVAPGTGYYSYGFLTAVGSGVALLV